VPEAAKVLKRMRSDIKKYGWHIVSVVSEVGTEWKPPFAYTIGLSIDRKIPELAIFGLPPEISSIILRSVREAIDSGLRIVKDKAIPDILENGFVIRVGGYSRKEHFDEYFGAAQQYFNGTGFRVAVLLWPDASGRINSDGGDSNVQFEAFELIGRKTFP